MSNVDISRDRIERLYRMGVTDYIHLSMLDHIEQLESRLKKAMQIVDDYAYANGNWIADIDYEEFYSWREDFG